MFEFLTPFDKILVVGPQRSGTQICARMIAYTLSKTFYHETEIGNCRRDAWEKRLEDDYNFVQQAPGMSYMCHEYGRREDLAIVMMIRDVKDIIRSEERISWRSRSEFSKYRIVAKPMLDQGLLISEIKYKFWREYQKGKILNPFEIEYSSLSEHKFWVDKEDRKDFTTGQVAIGKREYNPNTNPDKSKSI